MTFTLTGSSSGTTLSDTSGHYAFSSLPGGGSYIVTPTKPALTPGTQSINTIDLVAIQRHFLSVSLLPPGCRVTAADANGDTAVNTIDLVAIQRFFLGLTTGIGNTGKYQFSPTSRAYPGASADQAAQDYGVLVFGDVATPFAHRPEGPSPAAVDENTELPVEDGLMPTVTLSLPNVAVDGSIGSFVVPVTTTLIDAADSLVGFQGDFTFDARVVSFQREPVQKAGLTSSGWNVSGNVLDGKGPIRTLRVSAYSQDLTPLSGSGPLFELKMTRVTKQVQTTPMIWATAPDHFYFIDNDLKTHLPEQTPSGSVQFSEGAR